VRGMATHFMYEGGRKYTDKPKGYAR